ncbi:unnamed protein product [Lactuca virosa]|uniref:Uncharacterized protein n=1 Tax=Lactuca virosa TaxID=75947 RepID=A0AAU9M8H1_9ASTR|nr:unnamed protein product [Lactuca virosa]
MEEKGKVTAKSKTLPLPPPPAHHHHHPGALHYIFSLLRGFQRQFFQTPPHARALKPHHPHLFLESETPIYRSTANSLRSTETPLSRFSRYIRYQKGIKGG